MPSALLLPQALAANPKSTDLRCNLALLYEEFGQTRETLRHLAQHRRLTRRSPDDPGGAVRVASRGRSVRCYAATTPCATRGSSCSAAFD